MKETATQALPGIDLDRLQRFDVLALTDGSGNCQFIKSEQGAYVEYAAVTALIAQARAAQAAVPVGATSDECTSLRAQVRFYQKLWEQARSDRAAFANRVWDEAVDYGRSTPPAPAQPAGAADTTASASINTIRDYDEFDNPLDGQMGD